MVHIKILLVLIFIGTQQCLAQSDKKIIRSLKKDIKYLAADELEGRRTGTKGEELAAAYIARAFAASGLSAAGNEGGFLQTFEVNDGKEVSNASFVLREVKNILNVDWYPVSWSGDANQLTINSWDEVVNLPVDEIIQTQTNNPHFDLKAHLQAEAAKAKQEGKKLLMLLVKENSTDSILAFDSKDKSTRATVPVIVLKPVMSNNFMTGRFSFFATLNFAIAEKKRNGRNIAGYWNNNAKHTVVIGAHYDHLGYGEDHNSLYAGTERMIHNGADDNASGTAALIALTKILPNTAPKSFNYLFVAFSGEELGLYGSKHFADHCPVELSAISYMINMDMVGRLNDSTKGLTIGGYGTSPVWSQLIDVNDRQFSVKIDSAGSGPSDHTSFYRKDIPVLFFFTGTHSDYHKPSDDAHKINYNGELKIIRYIQSIIAKTDGKEKLAFTKTREANMGKSSFKVTLGIMPDYTFSGTGVLVEGVSDGRPAQKAGIKAGDVIVQMGEYKITDVQSYMQALNKFNKGQGTRVKVKRQKEDLELDIVF